MKWALVNPPWTFDGSIYFGCREPHLPLELQYAKVLLEQLGHDVQLFDSHLEGIGYPELHDRVKRYAPDFTVITTAPSYLFWRCSPPELRVPQMAVRALKDVGGTVIAVGPHGSTTPIAALKKLNVDLVVLGECEEVIANLARRENRDWGSIDSIAYVRGDQVVVQGAPAAASMTKLPVLRWPAELISKHRHHHHRFDTKPNSPGAEMEVSRGCPYHCTFCAKNNFRNLYRKRQLPLILDELDGLISAGAEYVYFVDEIFMPDKELLEALVDRPIRFGVQLRIDLWSKDMLDLLGRAGCVSIEAGVESITKEGRDLLEKKCKLSTDQLAELLIHARKSVPFVQANLLDSKSDDPDSVEAFRQNLLRNNVWANKPVPLFPYPGSPDYTLRWGTPDNQAWERAHDYYLSLFSRFSDIQEERPVPLRELERSTDVHMNG